MSAEPLNRHCCRRCWEASTVDSVERIFRPMIVCSECGNKRCPHATDHRLGCTDSNESGQLGSAYQ